MTEINTDFQHIIFYLQRYWVDWGCTLWQPYYSQVGAGTMNPPTITLSTPARSLGISPPFGSATSVSKPSGS